MMSVVTSDRYLQSLQPEPTPKLTNPLKLALKSRTFPLMLLFSLGERRVLAQLFGKAHR